MREFFQEVESKFDFDETVETLTKTIQEAGWSVLATHNLQQSLLNKGYDVAPVKVIELCNPHYSSKILSIDNERIFSNLMPCRISVYEKADNKVLVSLMDAGAMAKQIGGVVEEVMSAVYEESLRFIDVIRR